MARAEENQGDFIKTGFGQFSHSFFRDCLKIQPFKNKKSYEHHFIIRAAGCRQVGKGKMRKQVCNANLFLTGTQVHCSIQTGLQCKPKFKTSSEGEIMVTERRKIEYVTRVVSTSGGLGIMFFGLVIGVSAVLNYLASLGAQTRNNYGKDLTFSLSFMMIAAIFWLFAGPKIRGYLQEKYGQVRRESYNWREGFSDLFLLVPYFLAQMFGLWADSSLGLPFSATILFVAIFVFGLWFANQRGVSNFLLYLAGIIFVLSFAPWENLYALVTVLDDEGARSAFYSFLCSMIFGIVYFLLGLFNYRLMTSTLKPVTSNVEEGELYESV